MIKVENISIWGFEHAIRGMRNPMNSWNASDSEYGCSYDKCYLCVGNEECPDFNKNYNVGNNDIGLMQRLYKAGTEHRKYLRQIFVSMDITAPLYWWKEFDTYKVGTVSNSCSTMHKIHAKRFEREDFSIEHISNFKEQHWMVQMDNVISCLNVARMKYLETNDKKYWWQMIQLLPSSYNQFRTVTMNYETAVNIIHQRKNHKLDEWRKLCDFLLCECPYLRAIMDE